jgi:hypothetical protein
MIYGNVNHVKEYLEDTTNILMENVKNVTQKLKQMIPNEEHKDDFKDTEISVMAGIIIAVIAIGLFGAFLYAVFAQILI